MAVIIPKFLSQILDVHNKIQEKFPYPFFDPACIYYEAVRALMVDHLPITKIIDTYGLTECQLRKSQAAFMHKGIAGLLGLDTQQLTEDIPIETERMIYVLKKARSSFPATKMVLILKGFNQDVPLDSMRHVYASYGWALGTRPYKRVDFLTLNLKVITVLQCKKNAESRKEFFHKDDAIQQALEIFRTLGTRGITRRYSGSRVTFVHYKKDFLSLGLLGLFEKSRMPFRNSKLGFTEEGRIILSKIQHSEHTESYYQELLQSKKIDVTLSCIRNIFTRWRVDNFESKFVGDLKRFISSEDGVDEDETTPKQPIPFPSSACAIGVDQAFILFMEHIKNAPTPLANPGIFIFLPYIKRLRLLEKASSLMQLDPERGYSWFSLLLLNIGRIMAGISSITKSCRTNEISLPLTAGLVTMPCNDSLLNGLAVISEDALLQLRNYLIQVAKHFNIVKGEQIAFDFKMRDFSGDDITLKNIGKGPSPHKKICFPGFRPHIAWDVDTGTPICVEFRNGKARATTTLKRYIKELLSKSLGGQCVEHVYLDSEYTAEHIWQFIVDHENGLGADLTMCIKQNKRVKKYIDTFLSTKPHWLYYDDEHTYTEQVFKIPIQHTDKVLCCVLKRKNATGALRCFGTTVSGLDSLAILKEYRKRWLVENGIKDMVTNYFLDNIPGIDPHRINIHYFVVTLCRLIYEMFTHDFNSCLNQDGTKKGIEALRDEFIVGSNATLYKDNDVFVIKWLDQYNQNLHHALTQLFEKLNNEMNSGLPFLGGIKLKFDIVPPKNEMFKNQLKRKSFDF